MKICNKCEKTKPLDEFHRWKAAKDGRRSQCKSCRMPNGLAEQRRIEDSLAISRRKKCTACGSIKNFEEFYDSKSAPSGKYSKCAECCREHSRLWHKNNPEKSKAKSKRYKEVNKASIKETSRIWRENNRDQAKQRRIKRYYLDIDKFRERARGYARNRRKKNPELMREKRRNYHSENKNRKSYRENRVIRSVLNNFIRRSGIKKSGLTSEILGYSGEDLSNHLERQFVKGMNWENYGTEWHVDHIISVSEHIKNGQTNPAIVNCLTNLRPAWAFENLSKGDKKTHLL